MNITLWRIDIVTIIAGKLLPKVHPKVLMKCPTVCVCGDSGERNNPNDIITYSGKHSMPIFQVVRMMICDG